MEKIVLKATRRNVTGKKVGALRRAGQLPAVMYGHHFDPTPITLDLHDATKALSGLKPSALVTIELDGTQHAALIREKQRDFIKGTLLHVDFQVVSLTEKIRADVALEFVGEAPAVRDFNGVLITNLEEVEVSCLPQDLPEKIVVDVSGLARIGDAIYVRDLAFPPNVECLEDPDEVVAVITGGAEEEVAEAEEAGLAEPEVIERGKKEEEVEEE
ncbi:50S ribosomal protein L25 [Thermanaerothrix sp.]|jgi:large subunit ribosomal protein L25|uniref:50S ribosomal protein L25 n=1 Tax=Thermanaerothrix sp. TaxID=2972675 RepID=UPI002ADD6F54|nr:50S ribosomal protein L25 [Thermanaerothrix sp.]